MKLNIDKEFVLSNIDKGVKMELTDGVYLTVRHLSSKHVEKARLVLEKKFGKKFLNDPDKQERDLAYLLAYGAIVDWEGLEIDGEKAGRYDPKLMVDILIPRPILLSEIAKFASDKENYKADEDDEPIDLEDLLKN